VYVNGYTETDTSGMLSPPTVWRQQSEFVSSRESGQIPAAVRIGFECRCSVAVSMDTHVGLNVATRVCDVYPDKCWFAVLCRFWLQCSRTLRRRSAAVRLLRLWVRIPPGAWITVCCDCCVLSGRGLCDELVTGPEESHRLWCVVECDLKTPWMKRPWPTGGSVASKTNGAQRPALKGYFEETSMYWISTVGT